MLIGTRLQDYESQGMRAVTMPPRLADCALGLMAFFLSKGIRTFVSMPKKKGKKDTAAQGLLSSLWGGSKSAEESRVEEDPPAGVCSLSRAVCAGSAWS